MHDARTIQTLHGPDRASVHVPCKHCGLPLVHEHSLPNKQRSSTLRITTTTTTRRTEFFLSPLHTTNLADLLSPTKSRKKIAHHGRIKVRRPGIPCCLSGTHSNLTSRLLTFAVPQTRTHRVVKQPPSAQHHQGRTMWNWVRHRARSSTGRRGLQWCL
jgi:hypothetical protein